MRVHRDERGRSYHQGVYPTTSTVCVLYEHPPLETNRNQEEIAEIAEIAEMYVSPSDECQSRDFKSEMES